MALEVVKMLYEQERIAPRSAWHWERIKNVEELKKGLNFDPEFEYRMHISSAKYAGSYWKQAILSLNNALEIKPRSIAARSQLAWTFWQKGDKKEAGAGEKKDKNINTLSMHFIKNIIFPSMQYMQHRKISKITNHQYKK